MRLPMRPPLMLVDGPALNEAEGVEGRCSAKAGNAQTGRDGGAPMFHTRGLTLSREYSQIRTVVRARSAARGAPFWATLPEFVRVPVATHCEARPPACPWSPPLFSSSCVTWGEKQTLFMQPFCRDVRLQRRSLLQYRGLTEVTGNTE